MKKFDGAVTGRFSHDKPPFEEVERETPLVKEIKFGERYGMRAIPLGQYLQQQRAAEAEMAELEKRLLAEGYVRGVHDEWIKK